MVRERIESTVKQINGTIKWTGMARND